MSLGDPEQIVAAERELRDREAHVFDRERQRDEWQLEVQDAMLATLLDVRSEHTALDAGCGTGRHLPWLLAQAREVIAVDHSERSLAVARERVGRDADRLTAVAGDVRRLPLEDASVDRVLCVQVVQHIPGDTFRLDAVSELLRVLKPGGVGVVTGYRWLGRVKRHKEGFWGPELYRYAFTPGELSSLLRRAGFTKVEAHGAVVFPWLSARLGMSAESQVRIGLTPIGRHLSQYVVARGQRAG